MSSEETIEETERVTLGCGDSEADDMADELAMALEDHAYGLIFNPEAWLAALRDVRDRIDLYIDAAQHIVNGRAQKGAS